MPKTGMDTPPERFGIIGVDILPRGVDFMLAEKESDYLNTTQREVKQETLGKTTTRLLNYEGNRPVARVERPDEIPGFYL